MKKRSLKNSEQKSFVTGTNTDNDYLLLYTKPSVPLWLNQITESFTSIDFSTFDIKNNSISFLMLSIIEENVYATTGGYASAYIKYFIIRNFGLNIISNLILQECTFTQTS